MVASVSSNTPSSTSSNNQTTNLDTNNGLKFNSCAFNNNNNNNNKINLRTITLSSFSNTSKCPSSGSLLLQPANLVENNNIPIYNKMSCSSIEEQNNQVGNGNGANNNANSNNGSSSSSSTHNSVSNSASLIDKTNQQLPASQHHQNNSGSANIIPVTIQTLSGSPSGAQNFASLVATKPNTIVQLSSQQNVNNSRVVIVPPPKVIQISNNSIVSASGSTAASSNPSGASSSASASSSGSNLNDSLGGQIASLDSQQTQQVLSVGAPNTTTITLTNPHSIQNTGPNSGILFPLQSAQTQQYATFIDTNTGAMNGFSSCSPLGSSTSQYYTFQTGNSFANTSPSSAQQQQQAAQNISSPQHQQQGQSSNQPQQQSLYMIFDQQAGQMDLDNGPMDFDSHVSHTAQAAPITVNWLIDNFEPAEGCSLRRSTLYNYYLHHCTEQKIEAVNPASFGKMIRSVFLGLRTRRLGTRGNSKYHYYGIRVKASSPLNQIADDQALAIRNHPMAMSPTGSPTGPSTPVSHHHQMSMNNGNHHSPNKKIKNAHNMSNNQYHQQQQAQYEPVVEFKPIIANMLGGGDEVVNIPLSNQATSSANGQYMVILTNGGATQATTPQTVPNKSIQSTTTIAKTIKLNSQQSASASSIPSMHNQFENGQLQQQQAQQAHQPQPAHDELRNNSNLVNNNLTTTNSTSSNNNATSDPNAAKKVDETAVNENELMSSAAAVNTAQHMPTFTSINPDRIVLSHDCTLDDVHKFEELYKIHCERMLQQIVDLKSHSLEPIWLAFWRSSNNTATGSNFYEEQLSTDKFVSLCDQEECVEFVKQADFLFYQFVVEILIPDVFGQLPLDLVQAIRNMAKSVEQCMRRALDNVPERMRSVKMNVITAFAMTLRRYTSLNHLTGTVKNSMQYQETIQSMLHDIHKVDMNFIREQAKWTLGCDLRLFNQLENDFKASMRNPSWNLNDWISWLDTSVSQYLQEYEGTPKYAYKAKQFLLIWSFLCSSVVRDLTLRSAQTFGSYHLLRLFFDEFIFYLIEHKIANEYRITPMAAMSAYDLNTVLIGGQPAQQQPNNNPVATTSST